MAVRVRWEGTGRAGARPADLRRRGERMLCALGLAGAELSILLCDDPVMRGLNRRHRGLRRTTDVLSFPVPAVSRRRGGALGDVVISLPVARRQARADGCALIDRVSELLAHGILHLLGYEHRTEGELRRMRARTDLLCAASRHGDPPSSSMISVA